MIRGAMSDDKYLEAIAAIEGGSSIRSAAKRFGFPEALFAAALMRAVMVRLML